MKSVTTRTNHIELDVRPDATARKSILVWDLPVRLFHWMLVASFAGAWLTADSERWRDVHVLIGYGLAALIAFRMLWGVLGSRYARFTSFAAGPTAVLRYLKSLAGPRPEHHVGHNPAGAWAIFAIIGLALVTSLSGYMSYENIGGEIVSELHEGAATAMLVLAGVHVAGVLLSSVLHRENLVAAMLSGRKRGLPAEGIARPHRFVALLLVCGLILFAVLALLGKLPSVYAPEAIMQSQVAQEPRGERH